MTDRFNKCRLKCTPRRNQIRSRRMQVRHRRIWLCAGFMFCFVTAASAQSRYRTEVFGSVGVSGYIGFTSLSGVNLGGGIGYRPFSADRSPLLRMLGLEFESNVTRSSTAHGTRTQSYFTGNVLFHAPVGRVEPYFLLGGGVSHRGDTHVAGDIGVGAKIFLTSHVSIRPELRGFVTKYLGNFARFSVAAGYHW